VANASVSAQKPSNPPWFDDVDLRVGANKGHPTTPIEKAAKPSHRKGIRSPKQKLVQSIVREVAGYAPYERRVMELLRNSKVRMITWKSPAFHMYIRVGGF
jgi:large subunit ribosomal protein L36e